MFTVDDDSPGHKRKTQSSSLFVQTSTNSACHIYSNEYLWSAADHVKWMKRQRSVTDTIKFHILPCDTRCERKTNTKDDIKNKTAQMESQAHSSIFPRRILKKATKKSYSHQGSFKRAQKFGEKWLLSPWKLRRSFWLEFSFGYLFYTFSLLPQLKMGRSLFLKWDYFSQVAPSLVPCYTWHSWDRIWENRMNFGVLIKPCNFGGIWPLFSMKKYGAFIRKEISRNMTKPTKWLCAQRGLRSAWASAQSDQSLLCAQWVAKDPSFLHADSEDSDQTGRMPRLIWVFAGCTLILLVLSCRGSDVY